MKKILPKFISLDGIDGAGKTTQLNTIKKWFHEQNLPVLFTREPGGTDLGEKLRQILLHRDSQLSLKSEVLLMFAARQQHLDEVIFPALQSGQFVVSDRFIDATFAYQGGGRGLDWAQIEILENWVQQGFQPDLTFLLDVPLEIAMARIENTREKDRFEQEEAAFFQRVRQAYLDRAKCAPSRYELINANQDLAQIELQIAQRLQQLIFG